MKSSKLNNKSEVNKPENRSRIKQGGVAQSPAASNPILDQRPETAQLKQFSERTNNSVKVDPHLQFRKQIAASSRVHDFLQLQKGNLSTQSPLQRMTHVSNEKGPVIQLKGGKIPSEDEIEAMIEKFDLDSDDESAKPKVANPNAAEIEKCRHNAERVLVFLGSYEEVAEKEFGTQKADLLTAQKKMGEIIKEFGDKPYCDPFVSPLKSLLPAVDEELRIVVEQLQSKADTEGNYEESLEAQRKDHALLKEYLNEGTKSEDRRLANSCRWILSQPLPKVYAVTPTHDSITRAEFHDKKGQKAFFPNATNSSSPGDINSPPVGYSQKLGDDTNICFQPITIGGWNIDKELIAILLKGKSKQEVWSVIAHEVQHSADRHYERDAMSEARKSLEKGSEDQYSSERELQSYKTEYRAYSYQAVSPDTDSYSGLDNTVQSKAVKAKELDKGGFGAFPDPDKVYNFSPKQFAIFKHIHNAYAHTERGWRHNPVLHNGQTFREAVVAYWHPDTEGVNKYNSVDIDNFYNLLDQIGEKATDIPLKGSDDEEEDVASSSDLGLGFEFAPAVTPKIAPVSKKVSNPEDPATRRLQKFIDEGLSKADAIYIMEESASMRKKIDNHLQEKALFEVTEAIKKKAGK